MRQSQLKWFLIAAIASAAVSGERAEAATSETSLSLGYPNAGKLVGGRRFRETPFMVMVPDHASSRVRWALPALISVLDRASRIVARKFPGSVLELGELSRRDGGPISSHLSHQNGRDADIVFYHADLDGQPVQAPRFIRFDRSGGSRDDPTVRFDEKRNWAFVRAILEDPRNEVRQIFIYAPLRARLLAYAAKVKAPRELRVRAARAMMQPVNALPHDDHFHIRISCPADQVDQGCTDLPLWRTPGSPDEFGAELLAEAPPVRIEGAPNIYSPYAWGRISKLWSVEQGICHRVEMACVDGDQGPACEDLGNFGLPTPVLPPDEMGTPGEAPPPDLGAPPPDLGIPIASTAPLSEPNAPVEAPLSTPAASAPAATLATASAARGLVDATISTTVLAVSSQAQPAGEAASLLFCAPDDEPNTCELSVTALMTEASPATADRAAEAAAEHAKGWGRSVEGRTVVE